MCRKRNLLAVSRHNLMCGLIQYSYFIDCVNFIATQFNVLQTTQFNVSQVKLAGFIATQFNVSLPPYSYIVQVLATVRKKTFSK